MDHKELKEAIFDMFRKSKEAPKPQYKRIDSMLGGKMNLTADDFAQLDPNSDPEKLKAAFEEAYLRGNTDSRASLKTLLDTAPYNEMKDLVDRIDAARGTANTNPNRQFGASNQPTVRRSGDSFLREHNIYKQNNTNTMTQEQLRMQMLAGIITESQYKSMLNEEMKFIDANTMEYGGTEPLNPSKLKAGDIIAKNKSYKDKAELEAYAGKYTTTDVDGKVEWTEKDGTKSGWNDINDLVLVKNLTW